MEALAALSLVCNILQLVDAAGKAYNVCHEIHTFGASIEDQRMTYTSEQLQEAYTALNTSLKRTSSTSSQVVPSQVDLSGLGSRCSETAKALHDELLALRKKPDGGIRESVKVLVKKKRKARGIEQIKIRLDEYQKILDTQILIDLRQYVGRQTEMSDKIQQQLKELSQHLSSFHCSSSSHLSAEIAKAIQAIEKQHVRTRAHVSEAETHLTSRMQNIKLSQDQAHTHREQMQRSQQQRKHFLDSLTFPETNLRMNEIAASHRDTFQWIFDDGTKGPWGSFTTWLRGVEPVYWIHGKPGSGKSTLMKFLANASRTRDCLTDWYPNERVLIVTYYFWLSGSHIQRSLKGFLCSIIRQTIVNDERLLDTLLDEQPKLLEKRNINDWDPEELQILLTRLTLTRTLPVCYFIDGLDEYDQGDDVERVLSLIEKISSAGKNKFCVSSRPENYLSNRLSRHPQLRLQDLNAADMKTLICDELSNARSKCNPAQIDEEHLEKIVGTMSEKAEGVFLWVHYAINSLVKGMRNEDHFEDLLDRIEDLPSGMNQLYLQMWNRLNEDQQRYRDEAALYFSYCALSNTFKDTPISLFEMVIALSDSLRRMYIDRELPKHHINVAEQCELLERQLLIRCAGLLETVIDDWNADSHYSIQYRRLAWEDSHSPIRRMSLEGRLLRHHKMKIKFIHRTARDFLFDSNEGQILFGQPKESLSLRSQNFLKARMAVMVQGLEPFQCRWVIHNMIRVSEECKENEVGLIKTLKLLCERLSIPGMPSHNIGYQSFWTTGYISPGFEGAAAAAGCEQYIQHLLQRQRIHFSPYYLSFLILAFGDGMLQPAGKELESSSRWLSMTFWLTSSGADLRAKHINGYWDNNTVFCVLLYLSDVLVHLYETEQSPEIFSQIAKQATGIVEQLLLALTCSDFDCLVRLNHEDAWRGLVYWRAFNILPSETCSYVVVRFSATNLCWRIVQLFDLPVSSEVRCSQPTPQLDSKTRVLISYTNAPLCKVFNSEDSTLLGQKLEEVWFADADPSVSKYEAWKNFEEQLQEVSDRSTSMDIDDWALKNGFNFKVEDSIYTLDPSEDVDESNWREKGWFRKYDARDELHRSPEKLKMIERMEQFPDEDWGQENRSS